MQLLCLLLLFILGWLYTQFQKVQYQCLEISFTVVAMHFTSVML